MIYTETSLNSVKIQKQFFSRITERLTIDENSFDGDQNFSPNLFLSDFLLFFFKTIDWKYDAYSSLEKDIPVADCFPSRCLFSL